MEYRVRAEARDEFLKLPEEIRGKLKEEIESRRSREKNILGQRGVGTSYDSHGEPVNYFKMETEEENYRIFFDVKDGKVVLLGIRPRTDDTYINLRDYTRLIG